MFYLIVSKSLKKHLNIPNIYAYHVVGQLAEATPKFEDDGSTEDKKSSSNVRPELIQRWEKFAMLIRSCTAREELLMELCGHPSTKKLILCEGSL